jgi:hypothetical protein
MLLALLTRCWPLLVAAGTKTKTKALSPYN